ncbi:MAG: metal ABC transporter permease [Bdellovibrionaceae bacterium]|nr:metal ABC transporter permease [Pseudobdellovibrionaceae bacterium]
MNEPTLREAISFLAAPTAMCLILAVMHCYLGLHVLARGVIFVDLSLAQVASFGATVALLWDPEHRSPLSYFVALGATFIAAGVFAYGRRHERRFPQEALIGIVYAMATAAVVLVVDRLSHGAEHLKEAMIGQILWVNWQEVLETAAIYSGVGLVHFIFRKQFFASSASGSTHPAWDFLFYALFGVVITSSTHVAGVLMVFSFLIVPAVVSALFFNGIRARLLFGWGLSSVLSVAGMYISYRTDAPVGALMVVLFAAVPILALLFLRWLPVQK